MTQLASKRKLWFAISLVIIIPGLISLIFFGLKLGIDFTGGTLWEVRFDQPAEAWHRDQAVANAPAFNAVADRFHLAGNLPARRERPRRLQLILVLDDQHVGKIDRASPDSNQQLAGARRRLVDLG